MAKLQKFEVLAGVHCQDKKIYSTGDVVGSPDDLTQAFRGKFRRVDPNTPVSEGKPHIGQAPGTRPVPLTAQETKNAGQKGEDLDLDPIPAPKGRKTADTGEKDNSPPDGKDVTERFEKALEQDYKVFKVKGGNHFVYDADNLSAPINPEGAKAEDVDGVIDGALKGKK